jgi:glycoprotein 6-alpha-L-fucosyltransferase
LNSSLELRNKLPLVFLNSQFLQYIMRFNGHFMEIVSKWQVKKKFRSSCVGIHVRRTDKRHEAKYSELSEYMRKVDEYFKSRMLQVDRCIFLATDELQVISEAAER